MTSESIVFVEGKALQLNAELSSLKVRLKRETSTLNWFSFTFKLYLRCISYGKIL